MWSYNYDILISGKISQKSYNANLLYLWDVFVIMQCIGMWLIIG